MFLAKTYYILNRREYFFKNNLLLLKKVKIISILHAESSKRRKCDRFRICYSEAVISRPVEDYPFLYYGVCALLLYFVDF